MVMLADVWRALDVCLPGCKREQKLHRWWVYPPKGPAYRALPLGAHGQRRANCVEIEFGHVRSMARQFGVLECFEKQFGC